MSNVHRLPVPAPDLAAEALAEARAIPEGHLDRILDQEAARPTQDVTAIVDELAAAGRAVWLRRDAEAKAEQATRWAVHLEQTVGEIERVAEQWTTLHGIRAGMGNLLLDIIRGHRSDGGDAA